MWLLLLYVQQQERNTPGPVSTVALTRAGSTRRAAADIPGPRWREDVCTVNMGSGTWCTSAAASKVSTAARLFSSPARTSISAMVSMARPTARIPCPTGQRALDTQPERYPIMRLRPTGQIGVTPGLQVRGIAAIHRAPFGHAARQNRGDNLGQAQNGHVRVLGHGGRIVLGRHRVYQDRVAGLVDGDRFGPVTEEFAHQDMRTFVTGEVIERMCGHTNPDNALACGTSESQNAD